MCFSGLVREYTRATKLHLIRLVKRHHHRERAFPAIVVRSDSWPLRIRITRFVSTGYEARVTKQARICTTVETNDEATV